MLNEEPEFLAPSPAAAPLSKRWEAIAAALRAEIVQGVFAPGSRLPNESALAERFQVNRHTLRQAMQALAREGFVQVRHGSGTFVRELVLDYALQRRTRMSENLAEAGEQGKRELLAQQECAAGSRWASGLRVNPRTLVLQMSTRALVRGRPVSLSCAAYPLPRLGAMAEAFARLGSITAALAELGVADYTRARSVISARLPSQEEADALARPVTQPVLVVDYSNVDAAGQPVEAGHTLFAADAVQLTVGPDGWERP
ncbi:phosphonate metabolism transcriptional regulator PhnF [Roseateles oligotrophus]|uniref:Phosphonate metabolism transcriptional regulator PhnF n=1 Tax=Roseateles oligotrophus TaxID=1769250 RepID=A0ABT2YC31_9BURK|nr:phosphonate metabolism transcriptional regulator PhnF [Roseateles oligotrophus]MCV2367590.1 phosphonate metabolism transcriptional regulator PhnF [Roseateles oligotrophus]